MAPKACLGNYKIWGSPSVNDAPREDVWIAALNDAVTDGMDVINMSSGGTALTGALDTGAACGIAAGTPCDPLAVAFENAAKAAWSSWSPPATPVTIRLATTVIPTSIPSLRPPTAPSVIAVGAITNSHVMSPSVRVWAPACHPIWRTSPPFPAIFAYPSAYGSNTATLMDATAAGNDVTRATRSRLVR